jgi:hypothetical protein
MLGGAPDLGFARIWHVWPWPCTLQARINFYLLLWRPGRRFRSSSRGAVHRGLQRLPPVRTPGAVGFPLHGLSQRTRGGSQQRVRPANAQRLHSHTHLCSILFPEVIKVSSYTTVVHPILPPHMIRVPRLLCGIQATLRSQSMITMHQPQDSVYMAHKCFRRGSHMFSHCLTWLSVRRARSCSCPDNRSNVETSISRYS